MEETKNASRYNTVGGKQVIDLLKDELLTKEEYEGFLKGNIIKYVLRKKDVMLDLKKAKQYLEWLIESQKP
jgi:hypothetical protein